MNFNRSSFLYTVTLLALLLIPAQAQPNAPTTNPSQQKLESDTKRETRPEDNDTPKKESSEDVARLNTKVNELQSLVEQQHRMLTAMQKRLDEIEGKSRPAITAAMATVALIEPTTTNANPAPAGLSAATGSQQDSKSQVVASPSANQNKAPDKSLGVAGWDNTSAYIRSANGDYETRVTGFAQLDYRGYQSGNHPPNTYLVRRARMRTDAKLQRYYEVRVEAELADTTGILLRDFYLRIRRTDPFQVTFGQVREPFSQEELRPEPNQDFVERSFTSLLVPGRSPGVMVSGVIDKGTFEYQVGSFNGKGPLRENNNGTPESVVRLRFAPWKNGTGFWLKGLAFGGAYAHGKTDGGMSVRGQTDSRSFTFFTPDTVNGKIIRANGEMTWMLGPAALRAEYDQTNQFRANLGTNGTNLPGVVSKAYVAQFTYLLTGETKPENGATAPRHDLFSREGNRTGFGAWELKARIDSLQISDATAKSNRAESFYFGVNWYLNRFVRYVLDVGFERFNDSLRSPKPGDKNFFITMSRVQVTF